MQEKVGHPTKFDNLDVFTSRLVSKPYKKVIIFVDNSGADVILGIIPFARYLLTKGTAVILAANTRPAVNDITAYELEGIVAKVAGFDDHVKKGVELLKLKVVGTGSASPCLGECK
jgi:type II pantothenate kinase